MKENQAFVEKITLKPIAKELLYRIDDAGTHFDVFTYGGTTTAEKQLGTLYVVGHAKYDTEDLGYVVSLIGSLARREYYSEMTLKRPDPRAAFEQTLKKLNEVLEDFFTNKQLALNVGVLAVAGESLYLSKLGKFKVGLARAGEYIDVLNNLTLFQKSPDSEQQFSNVISGTIQAGDKLFAYIPSRPITSRERSLHALLVKDGQDVFTDHVAQLAGTNGTFTCCGLHIAVEQIKEIPLQTPILAVAPMPDNEQSQPQEPTRPPETPKAQERPRVIAAELSVGKKQSVFTTARLMLMKSHMRVFIVAAVVILVPLGIVVAVRATGESSSAKELAQNAIQNIKIAQARVAQSDSKGARALLWETLALLGNTQSPAVANARNEVSGALDDLDHVSSAIPQKSTIAWPSRTPIPDVHAYYDGNLYILKDSSITKNGKSWTKTAPADGIAIAIDGNIYILTKSGALMTYFLGEKKAEIATELALSTAQMAAIDDKKAPVLYVADPDHKRIYAINKSTGAVATTYKADVIPSLQEITVSTDGDLLIFDGTSVWTIATATPQ